MLTQWLRARLEKVISNFDRVISLKIHFLHVILRERRISYKNKKDPQKITIINNK